MSSLATARGSFVVTGAASGAAAPRRARAPGLTVAAGPLRTPATAPRGRPSTLPAHRRSSAAWVSRRRVSGVVRASVAVGDGDVSIVLLSGGVGKRMGASIPKQYLELMGKPIATWSLETFLGMSEVGEVVIVCDPSWKHIFEDALKRIGSSKTVKFALPGDERQDSMTNGFKEIESSAALVAIHDSARPLVTAEECQDCFKDGLEVGAAVLGVPVKPTIKEVGADGYVVKTLQRSALWEVQTPQVIKPALLREGIDLVAKESLEVTDDVSIIEALGKPVKITKGNYTNIKVTTPDDMSVAERFLDERESAAAA